MGPWRVDGVNAGRIDNGTLIWAWATRDETGLMQIDGLDWVGVTKRRWLTWAGLGVPKAGRDVYITGFIRRIVYYQPHMTTTSSSTFQSPPTVT